MDKYISRNDLYIQYGKNTKSSRTKSLLINKLIDNATIAKINNNQYKVVNKKKYHIFREYDGTNELLSLFKDFRFDYIIYNITFLNEWLNQLIGKNTIFIEADRKYLNSIYDVLVDNGYKNILLNPSLEEIDKYSSSEFIIIKPLFTRSPINRKEKSSKIEKIIVDVFADNILQRFFSTSEIPEIYRQIFNDYAINEASLNTYLSRRKIKDKFYNFLRECGLEDRIND